VLLIYQTEQFPLSPFDLSSLSGHWGAAECMQHTPERQSWQTRLCSPWAHCITQFLVRVT